MAWMCSADSHVIEPGDVWTSRVPASMKDRAPRIERVGDDLNMYVEGQMAGSLPVKTFALADGNTLPPDDVPGRLELIENDGIWAEALIGNLAGGFVFGMEEPEFAFACARAYNDWLAETFGPYADRQIGIAFVPLCGEPAQAVAEVERLAGLGLKGFALPLWPAEPYHLSKFEPIWEAAAAFKLPISFHAHTGPGYMRTRMALANTVTVEAPEEEPYAEDAIRTAIGVADATHQGYAAQQVATTFIGSGILERNPDLHLVFVECGGGWLVSAMANMDYAWQGVPNADRSEDKAGVRPLTWRYPLAPSEYARRQVHATFQDEPGVIKYRHDIGVSQLLWGSDLPHPEGTWPISKEFVAELFEGVEADEKNAMLTGNFAKLYRVEIPA
jgi:predicted TIM-barrel fold metal-dependent hydrolase